MFRVYLLLVLLFLLLFSSVSSCSFFCFLLAFVFLFFSDIYALVSLPYLLFPLLVLVLVHNLDAFFFSLSFRLRLPPPRSYIEGRVH